MKWIAASLLAVVTMLESQAQELTVGLVEYDERVSEGYTLLTSHRTTSSFLIDNCGFIVHEWTSDYNYGNSVDLLENGLLLRSTQTDSPYFIAGGAGGRVELLDWNSNIVWEMVYSSDTVRHHHDAVALPNGNILILAWDRRDKETALNAGINPEFLDRFDEDIWGEHILEVTPVGNNDYEIVWEWYLWDHLIQDFDSTKLNYGVVEDHPELVDLNYNVDPGVADWIHANALDYNEELDQIIISSRNFDEFWIIDHSTTIEEAKGHTGGNSGKGGDIIYRYGNPLTYRAGTVEDQVFFNQHNPQWLSDNEIMVFNNGNGRDPQFSEIFFMNTPLENGIYPTNELGQYDPKGPLFTYSSEDIEGFNYSGFISGVELLTNGNYLICSGPSGTITEITPQGETLWTYINPFTNEGLASQGDPINGLQNFVYRAKKYTPDYPGLNGRTLEPTVPVENNPLPSICQEVVSLGVGVDDDFYIYPNPVIDNIYLHGISQKFGTKVRILGLNGRLVLESELSNNLSTLDIGELSTGVYILEVLESDRTIRRRFIKQ